MAYVRWPNRQGPLSSESTQIDEKLVSYSLAMRAIIPS